MNKTLAISVIVLVAVIMGMSSTVPMVSGFHIPSHRSNLLVEQPCGVTDCTIFIDKNRDGFCTTDEVNFEMPFGTAVHLFQIRVLKICAN